MSDFTGILLVLLYTGIFLWVIARHPFFKCEKLSSSFISFVFIIKILTGTFLALVYTYYYTNRGEADIFKFFDDSEPIYNALWQKPKDFLYMVLSIDSENPYYEMKYYSQMNYWHREYENNLYNDSHTIIRYNAVLRIFSFGYYHVHTVFTCFLSLIGLVALYKTFAGFCRGKERIMAVLLFFLPSVLFWGSGVLKESLLIFVLGLMLWQLVKLLDGKSSLAGVTVLGFSLFILMYLKIYVLMALIPGILGYSWIKLSGGKKPFLKYAVSLALCVLGAIYFYLLFPNYPILETLALKQADFSRMAGEIKPGSMVYVVPLESNLWSFIKASPVALYNVLFRPFVFEADSPFVLMAALENLFFIALGFVTAFTLKARKETDPAVFVHFTMFVVLLFLLVGLITPVMGAIVRYKVPALPFFAFLLVYLIDKEKLVKLKFVNYFKGKKWMSWIMGDR